jgi:hypothetical protein
MSNFKEPPDCRGGTCKGMEQGAWSREQGAWSREQGARSMEQGAGSKEVVVMYEV